MNDLKKLWTTLNERFSELSSREKWLVTLAGWITFGFLLFTFLVEPMQIKNKSHEAHLAGLEGQVVSLHNRITELNKMLKEDPNKRIDREYQKLLQTNQELSEQLAEVVNSLVTPTAMASLLEKVLKQTQQLKLVSLESQPNEPIMLENATEDIGYYIHPVKIVLTGKYFDIEKYLSDLEQMSVKYYWRSFDYKVVKYPQARLELVVYTLGAKEEFIGG